MPKYQPDLDLIRRLEAANVVAPSESAVCAERGILIEQDLEPLANMLSETEHGICGLIIDCSFTSTLPNSFLVRDFTIELPWGRPHVDWLLDPALAKSSIYKFPGHRQYHRNEVLNHRRLDLRPGRTVTGKLLGVISDSIPAGLPLSTIVPMKLILTDYLERSFSEEIRMVVDRSERLLARQEPWQPGSSKLWLNINKRS